MRASASLEWPVLCGYAAVCLNSMHILSGDVHMKRRESQKNNPIRDAILHYAAHCYGTRPEYFWVNSPGYAVLRHEDNKKWYGLIMDVPNTKLSLPGNGSTDILEILCDNEVRDLLRHEQVLLPAYHMRKEDWSAVLLDGSVDIELICDLLDRSFYVSATEEEKERSLMGNMPLFEEDTFFDEEPFDDFWDDPVYADEPISLSPEQKKILPPQEYGQMRKMAAGSSFMYQDDEKIFYQQATYMAQFEDDCPYDREVLQYYPTYQYLSLPELRGYFTWRTRLRRGNLKKTSLTYAFLYLYELIHQIGSETKQEGLDKLIWFYEKYGAIDGRIKRYAKQWIVDYAIYYDIPAEQVRKYIDTDFEEALLALCRCDTVDDDVLLSAILQLSVYRLNKSKAYKQVPEVLKYVICTAYRSLHDRYAKRYHRPYAQKIYGKPKKKPYTLFQSAVFYSQKRIESYEYCLTPFQTYRCRHNCWSLEQGYRSAKKERTLGVLVHTADRLVRESFGIKPALQVDYDETKTMRTYIRQAIEAYKKTVKPAAAPTQAAPHRPEIVFDLSKLEGIRRSAETVGQKLMTEEERYVEQPVPVHRDTLISITETQDTGALPLSAAAPEKRTGCVLSGQELRFMQLLLYGGDWRGFLTQRHLMASVLAETINDRLFDEFSDTVIIFDGNRPVIVDEYREELKGMIPK